MPEPFRMQEKLEWGELATFVPNKGLPVYNWFYYKEGFSRDLVMELLRMFGPGSGDWVLDPFCGAGTTMLGCLESGVNSVGFDVHPVSVFASRVKLRDYEPSGMKPVLKRVLGEKYRRPRFTVRLPIIRKAFPPRLLEQVIFFRNLVAGLEDEGVREFFMLALMNVAVKSSYLWKDGAVLKVRKKPVPPVKDMLRRQAGRMIRDLERFGRKDARAMAEYGDARSIRLEDGSVRSVITSPPYLNKIEYTRIYEVEQELFLRSIFPAEPVRTYIGLTLDRMERSSGALARILDQDTVNGLPQEACPYFVDMEQAIGEMYRVMEPGGRAGLVVGNGCFPDRVVESDVLLSRIAEGAGFEVERIVVLNKRWCTRKRTEKVGMARESLLLWRKPA
jgi:DNA modification methylase